MTSKNEAKKWKLEGKLFDKIAALDTEVDDYLTKAQASKDAMWDAIHEGLGIPKDTHLKISTKHKGLGVIIIEECSSCEGDIPSGLKQAIARVFGADA